MYGLSRRRMLGNFDSTTSAAAAGRDFDLPECRPGAPRPNMNLCRRDSFFTLNNHEVAAFILRWYALIHCSIVFNAYVFKSFFLKLTQAGSNFQGSRRRVSASGFRLVFHKLTGTDEFVNTISNILRHLRDRIF